MGVNTSNDYRPYLFIILFGTIVGYGVSSYILNLPSSQHQPPPPRFPFSGKTIRIGFIAPNTVEMETYEPLFKDIIQPDVQQYLDLLSYDVDVEFLIDDATGQPSVHLEKMEGFAAMDISTIITGGWDNQLKASLPYSKKRELMMIGVSSTSTELSVKDDYLFRLCAPDTAQGPALAQVLLSLEKSAVIVVQNSDASSDTAFKSFEEEYMSSGGIVVERLRFSDDYRPEDYLGLMDDAEQITLDAVGAYGRDSLALLMVMSDEFMFFVEHSGSYPAMSSVDWFGSDGTRVTVNSGGFVKNADLRLFCLKSAALNSSKYREISDRYSSIVNQPLDYYSACAYDASFIVVQSILEAQSGRGDEVREVFPVLAGNHFGVSGWTLLDENGDRFSCDYQVWSYRSTGSSTKSSLIGYFNSISNKVFWVNAHS